MSKQILTDKETKHFLMKAFGCTQQFVWQALTFRRDSETARRIRVLALKRGGKLVDGYVPKCDVVDKETGDVSVYVDGQLKDSYKNITVPDLMQLQGEVQLMATAL